MRTTRTGPIAAFAIALLVFAITAIAMGWGGYALAHRFLVPTWSNADGVPPPFGFPVVVRDDAASPSYSLVLLETLPEALAKSGTSLHPAVASYRSIDNPWRFQVVGANLIEVHFETTSNQIVR